MNRHVQPQQGTAAAQAADAPRLSFWGVRGSLPTPGADSARYGGHTSCIEVTAGGQRFIVDAGSGLMPLGKAIAAEAGTEPLHILLTHLHHDHVLGLPFFKPMYQTGREVHLWCGNLDGECAAAALSRMFSPPLFPVSFAQMPADIRFHGFRAGETLSINGLSLRTAPLNHPSGATGYRFDAGGGSAAIITDIEHAHDTIEPDDAVLGLCRGADTIVYDMMMEESDFPSCKGWGHSTAAAGVRLAERAGARQLVGFHHSPLQDDVMMDDRARRLQSLFAGSLMAREGVSLTAAAPAR
jgi:phosphoribosyl 1,2-cyclic phosphodiesterase